MESRRLSIITVTVIFMLVTVWHGFKAEPVSAADYPDRIITWIISTTAGGGYDLMSRNIARFFPNHLPKKATIVLQNKPGASQMIAVHTLWAAKPDGYTICSFNAIGALMAKFVRPGEIKFDVLKFEYLGMWQDDTRAIGISKFLKVNNWKDFVARSKEKPILVGTGGAGGSQHIDPLMVEAVTDLNLKYIHYPGSAQTAPAMGRNEVEMEIAQLATTEQLKDNGLGRTFCVLSDKRSRFAPDVPTALEVGMPAEQFEKLMDAPFFGVNRVIAAPPGTDPKVVKILRKAVWDTFHDPGYLAQLKKLKGDNNPMRGEDYQKAIARKLKAAQENQKMIDMIKM